MDLGSQPLAVLESGDFVTAALNGGAHLDDGLPAIASGIGLGPDPRRTRRLIVIGGAIEAEAKVNPELDAWVRKFLDRGLARALVGLDLRPAETPEPAASPFPLGWTGVIW